MSKALGTEWSTVATEGRGLADDPAFLLQDGLSEGAHEGIHKSKFPSNAFPHKQPHGRGIGSGEVILQSWQV